MFSQYAGPVGLVILACLVGINCGDNPGSYSDSILDRCDYNVNGFILDKLDDNRVVMIGDHGHSLYFYKRTVTHFLRYWLDQIEAGNGKAPHRLFLILEGDSLKAKKAGCSMTRRGTEACLTMENLISPSFSLGSVQFTSEDLSGIRNRVARLNAGSSLGDSVCFEIVGPERPIDIGDWDELRRDSFFVYERDEYSYSYVARLLRANPDYKALVFYGATHLHRGRVQKQTGTIADGGYYLAHYLTEDSLIDGVYTILQTYATKPDIRIHESLAAPDSSYAISSEFVDIQVKTANLRSTYSIKEFDGAIVHFGRPVRDRVLLEVWSETMAGRIMEPMCNFSDSNDYFCRMIWRKSENYLRTISGLAYPTDSAAMEKQRYRCDHWVEWYADAQLDLVEDIVSLRLWERLIRNMKNADGRRVNWYETLLASSLRIPPTYDTLKSPEMRAIAYRMYIENNREFIVIDNLIGLLWVGSDAEAVKAEAHLKKITGQDFQTPGDWSDWWREQQFRRRFGKQASSSGS